jgi:hypothetical protein
LGLGLSAAPAHGLVWVGSSGYNHIEALPRKLARLKIRRDETDNSPVVYLMGAANHQPRAPEPGKDRVTNSDEHRTTSSVGDSRLRLIRQRLRSDFYEVPPASEHIAVSVMAELNDLEGSTSVLPR